MTLKTLILIFAVLTTIALAIFVGAYKQKGTDKQQKNNIKFLKIWTVVLAVLVVIGCSTIFIGHTATLHGMETYNTNISEAAEGIKNTPRSASKLPDDTTGSIIIVYKFDCNECKAIYKDLKTTLKDNNNVYWIASTTELGKEIVEEYGITDVPSGIYVRHNNFNGNVKGTRYKLSTKNDNDDIIINETALNRLLYLQTNNE